MILSSSRLAICVLLGLAISYASASNAAAQQTIRVDASKVVGTIKRVNDVNNGPLCQRGIIDLSPYYKQLGIRNVRLHDVPWSYDNVLDINYVFPNWKADPEQPENYDFTQSDFYLKTIQDLGINMIYRLGYSAEYKTALRHSAPPDSFDKWTDIATHIVRHYNDGWAYGPRLGIKYWEIWNEPDGDSLVFWSGNPNDFYRLYENTARALKKLNPSLKVGGPAICCELGFLEGFLKYNHEHNVPLDFVSWHIYTSDPHQVAIKARNVHNLMVKYGFGNAESILDEWNYGPTDWSVLYKDAAATRAYFDATQNAYGAAFDVIVMNDLQDAPVDIATYYSGTTLMFGLFTSSGAPQKVYYSFLAFQQLLSSPQRVAVEQAQSPDITTVAGLSDDHKTLRVLLGSVSQNEVAINLVFANLPWSGSSSYEISVIDAQHTLEKVDSGTLHAGASMLQEALNGPSVYLLTLRPASE